MNTMFKTKIKIKPMFQKHEGSKTIKRFGIEFRFDLGSRCSMAYFVIGFLSRYYYIGLFINKIKVIKKPSKPISINN